MAPTFTALDLFACFEVATVAADVGVVVNEGEYAAMVWTSE